jgi:hypothetical protein
MIKYEKALWGFPLMLRVYGSAFPRALPALVITAIYTLLLVRFATVRIQEMWIHPYAYSSFAYVVGFILVFR